MEANEPEICKVLKTEVNQALTIPAVVRQSEQFYCELAETPNNKKCIKQCGRCEHKEKR